MNLQRFNANFAIFLCFQYRGVTSTIMDDHGFCQFTDEQKDICSFHCYKSIKQPLGYILELKEQLKVTAEENIERDQEVKKLNKKLLNIEDNMEQLEDLRKLYRESIQIQKQNTAKLDYLIASQSLNQDNLKKEILKLKEESTQNQSNVAMSIKNVSEHLNEMITMMGKDILPKSSCFGHPSGIYNIKVPGIDSFPVLCSGDVSGGWITILRRTIGIESFYRGWSVYRSGFGVLDGDFFIGLEKLHRITNSQQYEIYMKFIDYNGEFKDAFYNNFKVDNEDNKYMLNELTGYWGSDYDGLRLNQNQKFSTFDNDNDQDPLHHCAKDNSGAWWYNDCQGPNPNGKRISVGGMDTMSWNRKKPLASIEMFIRPSSK